MSQSMISKGSGFHKLFELIKKIRAARARLHIAQASELREKQEGKLPPSPDVLRPYINAHQSSRAARFILSNQSTLSPSPPSPAFSSQSDTIRSPLRQSAAAVGANPSLGSLESLRARWYRTLIALFPLGGASLGNDVTIYPSGDEAFDAMWQAIRHAKRRVYAETYIIEEDQKGLEFMVLLKEAALRGCEVIFTYDPVGSFNFDVECPQLREIVEAGGQVEQFNPPGQWTRVAPIRNHRKILIVDDVAFTGGVNIGDNYCGVAAGGNGFFRDTHARVVGPAVQDLERVFFSSLHATRHWLSPKAREALSRFTSKFSSLPNKRPFRVSGEAFRDSLQSMGESITRQGRRLQETYSALVNPEAVSESTGSNFASYLPGEDRSDEDGLFVQVLPSNGLRRIRHIQRALLVTLGNCQSYCYITTPYFLPPARIRDAMIRAARRGIDVRILTSGKTDVEFMRFASRHIYPVFVREGIRLYEMKDKALHAKTLVIDNIYTSVGSFNLDVFSNRNLEVNITMVDSALATQMREQFFKDLEMCEEISPESIDTKYSLRERLFYRLHYYGARLYHRFAHGDTDYDD